MNENNWKPKWNKEQIKTLLVEQFQSFLKCPNGIEREKLADLKSYFSSPQVVIITGLRRVGKSTLLAQFAHTMDEGLFYYLNFDDERFLGFASEDFNDLLQVMIEVFGERNLMFLDEIQNVPGWERFVRRMSDAGMKFYVTGSNASLLSQELGTRLTGRYIPVELYPFSFREYLKFKGIEGLEENILTTRENARLQRLLTTYLMDGGIPEPLKYPDIPLRQTLYEDILYRDIASRHHIEDVRSLKELVFYLMSNVAHTISYNKLKEQLHLGSVNTIKSYIDYLETSWLMFAINLYDYSVKRQQIAPKKIYAIDTGLSSAVSFSSSPNTGWLMENVVFLELKRRVSEVYYYMTPSRKEVDFYAPSRHLLIQVSTNLENPQTYERETSALFEAMETLKNTSGIILTDGGSSEVEQADRTIQIRNLGRWLLGG